MMQSTDSGIFVPNVRRENAVIEPAPIQSSSPITRRKFLQTGVRVAIGGGLVCAATGAYAHTIAPARCTFPEIELQVPNLPRAFDGFRVALIADLHLDEEPDTQRLNRLVARVNAWQPDTVALVGDFISYEAYSIENQLVNELGKLRARDGVWATMGNHEHFADNGPRHEMAIVRRALKAAGITELCNRHTTIERDGSRLVLAGLDSYYGNPDLDTLQAQLPTPRQCTILMMHEPDYADITAPRGCFDLQLSGHSHGGQVVVPFVGPPVLPPRGQKYHTGLYRVEYNGENGRGEMLQYTTRGAGTSGTRVRFNCPPEISFLTLRVPQNA